MTTRRRMQTLLASLTLVIFSTGCATRKDVEQAITNANAAMVAPYLEPPGKDESQGWREAIAEMDRLITGNPGQDVLINQLRLRQALLLAINKKDDLAAARWETINPKFLKTERDQAFYQCRDALGWAYKTLPQSTLVSAKTAAPHLAGIDSALGKVTSPDTRIFLHMIRAQIQLKVANSIDEDENPAETANLLAASLATFVDAYPEPDRQWVREHPSGGDPVLNSMSDFRRRIWLRETIKAFRAEAKDKGYQPTWTPEWIARFP